MLTIEGLQIVFPVGKGNLTAVDRIDLEIGTGETVGLVGESGSGKTITGRSIMNLVPKPGRISKGKILFKGKDIVNMHEDQISKIRGKEISAIQQDPLSSLNPAFRVETQMIDTLILHKGLDKSHAVSESLQILRQLGITNPAAVMQRYPHQLSGGMAQRVMIGIAFSCSPSLVIADEPTTALDVITQAAVIELMKKFQTRFNTSVLFITHNLGLAAQICSKIAVMYAGKIVEFADTQEIFTHPAHPYTEKLLASVPKVSDTAKRIPSMPGGMPSLISPPIGCRFYERCAIRIPACAESDIQFQQLKSQYGTHRSLCLRADEVSKQ